VATEVQKAINVLQILDEATMSLSVKGKAKYIDQYLDEATASLGAIYKSINANRKKDKIPQREKERMRYRTMKRSFIKEKGKGLRP